MSTLSFSISLLMVLVGLEKSVTFRMLSNALKDTFFQESGRFVV